MPLSQSLWLLRFLSLMIPALSSQPRTGDSGIPVKCKHLQSALELVQEHQPSLARKDVKMNHKHPHSRGVRVLGHPRSWELTLSS